MRFSIPDLLPGTDYVIQVRGSKGNKHSKWSPVFKMTTLSDTVKPNSPASITWVASGDSFHAEWDGVNRNANGNLIPVTRYELELVAGGIGKIVSVAPATVGNKNVYDLSFEQNRAFFANLPRPTVTLRVRSVDNKELRSDWSAYFSATNALPSAVASVTATALNDSIALNWPAATDNDIIGYNVFSSNDVKIAFTTSLSYLHVTTFYGAQSFKVRSVDKFNQESAGTASNSVTPISPFIVDVAAPDTPVFTTGSSAIVNNASGNGAQATVTWTQTTPNPNDLQGFEIRFKSPADSTWFAASRIDVLDRTAKIPLGLAYTNYDFQIRSLDRSANYSPWSSAMTLVAPANQPPGTVSGLAATPGKDNITFNWTALPDTDIKNYEFTLAKSADFTSSPLTLLNGTSSTLSAGGLDTGTTYYARVRAIDTGGLISPAWSSTVSASTTTYPTASLSNGVAPTSSPTPVITPGIGNLFVQWLPISNPDLTTYEVHISTTSNFTPSSSTKVGELAGTFVLINSLPNSTTPLAYGTTYYVRLIAKDRDGSAPVGNQASGAPLKVGANDSNLTAANVGADPAGSAATAQSNAATDAQTKATKALNDAKAALAAIEVGNQNLVTNGDYEDSRAVNVPQYSLDQGLVAVYDTTKFRTGSRSIKMSGANGTDAFVDKMIDNPTFKAGIQYVTSEWIYIATAGGQDSTYNNRFMHYIFDGSTASNPAKVPVQTSPAPVSGQTTGSYIQQYNGFQIAQASADSRLVNQWQRIWVTWIPQADTDISPRLYVATGGTVYRDGFQVEEGNFPTAWKSSRAEAEALVKAAAAADAAAKLSEYNTNVVSPIDAKAITSIDLANNPGGGVNLYTRSRTFALSDKYFVLVGGSNTSVIQAPTYKINENAEPVSDSVIRLTGNNGFAIRLRELKSANTWHTISFWAKSNTSSNQNLSVDVNDDSAGFVITPTWKKYTATKYAGTLNSTYNFTDWEAGPGAVDILIYEPMLEVGKTASGYSRAPEEILAVGQNLITNSSFEEDTTTFGGYFGNVNGTYTDEPMVSGTRSLRITRNSTSDAYATEIVSALPALVNGQPITVSYTMRSNNGGGIDLQPYSFDEYFSHVDPADQTARRYSYTYTPNKSSTWRLIFRTGPNVGDWAVFDGIQVELGTVATAWKPNTLDAQRLAKVYTDTTVITAANGKNKVTHSGNAATGGGIDGDTWYQENANGNVIAMWRWASGGWQPTGLNHEVMSTIDIGKATVGTLDVANRIAAGAITTKQLSVGDPTNLVFNFNDAYDRANNGLNTGFAWSYAGAEGYRLYVGTTATDTVLGPSTTVNPGEELNISVNWYKAQGASTETVGVHLIGYGKDGNYVQEFGLDLANGSGPTDNWNPISTNHVVPANVYRVIPILRRQGGNVGTDWYFRDLYVKKRFGGSLIVDGAIQASKLNISVGGGNLLTNSDFRNTTDRSADWVHYVPVPGTTFAYGVDGGERVVVPDGGQGGQATYRGINGLTPGTPYVFSAYAEVIKGVGFVDTHDGTGAAATVGERVGPGPLRRVSVKGVVNSTGTITAHLWTGGSSDVMWRRAQFELGDVLTAYSPKSDEILPGTIFSPMIGANEVKTANLDAGAVKARNLSVSFGGGNITRNSNFSTNTAGWSINTNGTNLSISNPVIIDSPIPAYSNKVIQLTQTTTSGGVWSLFQSPAVGPFIANQKYTYSVWARTLSGGTNWSINFANGAGQNGGVAAWDPGSGFNFVTTSEWKRYTGTFTAMTGGADTTWYVGHGTNEATVTQFAGFQLEQGEIASGYSPKSDEILPGTITGEMFVATTGIVTTLQINPGGVIKSSNYNAANGTGWSLGELGLDVRQGSVAANTLIAGTGIINNLLIKNTGSIQSEVFNSTAGFQLSSSGLTINDSNSTIKADAIKTGTIGNSGGQAIQIASGSSLVFNFGHMRSSNYGSTSYNAAATAGFFISDSYVHIPQGNVAVSTLTSGTLNATTINLGDAGGPRGIIQSLGYDGSSGFRLSPSGLEVPNGSIAASKIVLQAGTNMMHPIYSDFESDNRAYDNFGGQAVIVGAGMVTGKSANAVFGSSSLGTIWGAASSNPTLYLGRNQTDYNIPLTAGQTYLVSAYAWCGGSVPTNIQMKMKSANGTVITLATYNLQNGTGPSTAIRLSGQITAPVNNALLYFESSTLTANGGFNLDGIQVEPKTSGTIIPSPWTPGSSTYIDANQIRTGEIRSTVTDSNTGQPTWVINMVGKASFSGASIYGNTIIGAGTNDNVTVMASSNYSFGSRLGWQLSASGSIIATEAQFLSNVTATNASGNRPAVIIGDKGGAHMRLSDARIVAMANDTVQDLLILNQGGRTVSTKFQVESSEDANTNSGNMPPLRVGPTSGRHLRIGQNDIHSMNGDTGVGNFGVNPQGWTTLGSVHVGQNLHATTNVTLRATSSYAGPGGTGTVIGEMNVGGGGNISGKIWSGSSGISIFGGHVVASIAGFNATTPTSNNTVNFHALNINSYGNTGITDTTLAGGGFNGASINANGRIVRTSSSSRRYKENIIRMDSDVARRALNLEAVTFTYKPETPWGEMMPGVIFPGFIAEQAEDAGLGMWVVYGNEGQVESFKYAELSVAHNVLIKDLYEKNDMLERQVAEQATTISDLESRMRKIEELLSNS